MPVPNPTPPPSRPTREAARRWMLLAVLCLAGCRPAERAAPEAPAPDPDPGLTNTVWMQQDTTGRPGPMRIFLSDGTLVIDSCWETYQLAEWRLESDSQLVFVEVGVEIPARILVLEERTLQLRLQLVDGTVTHTYQQATVPFVCPSLPR